MSHTSKKQQQQRKKEFHDSIKIAKSKCRKTLEIASQKFGFTLV